MSSPTNVLRDKIAAHRSGVSSRRARSYVDCPDEVLGMAVQPLTPATWTLLHATANRVVTGEVPLEPDIRNYLWFHSWLFPLGRFFSGWRLRCLIWLALIRWYCGLRRGNWYVEALALAGMEIRGLLEEALADAPAGGGDCAPGPCLQAQFEHFCATSYGWAPAFTSSQPLRRLFQLRRCLDASDADDEGERQIRFAHLRERNEQLALARQSKIPATVSSQGMGSN
jgi:hypothetical protein